MHSGDSSSKSLSLHLALVLVVICLYCIMVFQKTIQARFVFAEM